MSDFARKTLWLALIALVLVLLRMPLAAAVLFLLPAAQCWAIGARNHGVALVLLACVLGWAATGDLAWAPRFGLLAGFGALLGAFAHRGFTFGQCASALALAALVLLGAAVALRGPEIREAWTILSNNLVADLEAASPNPDSVAMARAADLRWLDTNLPYVGVGVVFRLALMSSVLLVWALARRLRGSGFEIRGRFREMRPPEWLVWLAIAAALMGLADLRWPSPVLRAVSWNLGFGLEAAYWLNGLSILVYALVGLSPRSPGYRALVAVLFALLAGPLLAMLGLFDTWFVFRGKVDRLLERREAGGDEK